MKRDELWKATGKHRLPWMEHQCPKVIRNTITRIIQAYHEYYARVASGSRVSEAEFFCGHSVYSCLQGSYEFLKDNEANWVIYR